MSDDLKELPADRFCPLCGYEGEDVTCPVCDGKTESLDAEIEKIAELEKNPKDILADESLEEAGEKEILEEDKEDTENKDLMSYSSRLF